jgi:hypothetical protein
MLWISVEQVTAALWERDFVANDSRNLVGLADRRKSLSNDSRTWSTAVRQELLFQAGVLTPEVYSAFYQARKARNKLVHSGGVPHADVVALLSEALVATLEKVAGVRRLGVRDTFLGSCRN